MSYLNLDPDYFNHPKTLRLIALCGIHADIYPIRLWAYCGKYHPTDGALKNYTAEEIEFLLRWSGEPGHLINSMIKVGFLHQKAQKNIFYVHDWKDHEGHIIAFKERSKKANKARWNKAKQQDSLKHPSRSPKVDIKESPYLTIPNHTLPIEEEGTKDHLLLSESLKKEESRKNPPEVNLSKSLNGKKKSNSMTDDDWLAMIKANPAYQGLDVDNVKAKLEAWCLTKGKKSTRARLLNWLNREEKPFQKKGPALEDADGRFSFLIKQQPARDAAGRILRNITELAQEKDDEEIIDPATGNPVKVFS